jgi:toxin-antitoxin system PIN domain toxin
MTWLLDGNVLIALAWPGHAFHSRASLWLAAHPADCFATCPVTEGTLLRLHMQHGRDKSACAAWSVLASLHAHPKHVFWPENFSYSEIDPTRLTGHRQITDAWLAELARRNGGMLATLDESLSTLWPHSTRLIPV